ncbi:MAG TPA: hypothetical protein VF331_06295 [Polyangiales bacterium]
MSTRISVLLIGAALACGCAHKGSLQLSTAAGPKVKAAAIGTATAGSGDARCNANMPGREFSEYDTSGDGVNDVRKVFMSVGEGSGTRLILICRESDVNADGRMDVVRYYDDEGRSLREEADRNFDGKMDLITVYQNGQVVRQEFDSDYDGKIDTKIFIEQGQPTRAERDLKGRSTATQWHPDRWEYYEGGKVVRMGTDLDGDSRVDRWDRDAAWKRDQDAPAAAAATAGADG